MNEMEYNNRGYDNRDYDNRGYDNRGYDNRNYDNRDYDTRGYDLRNERNYDLRNERNERNNYRSYRNYRNYRNYREQDYYAEIEMAIDDMREQYRRLEDISEMAHNPQDKTMIMKVAEKEKENYNHLKQIINKPM